jgi:hypothetical protein
MVLPQRPVYSITAARRLRFGEALGRATYLLAQTSGGSRRFVASGEFGRRKACRHEDE